MDNSGLTHVGFRIQPQRGVPPVIAFKANALPLRQTANGQRKIVSEGGMKSLGD